MQIAKFLIAAVFFTPGICRAQIIEALVHIVTSCYKNRINGVGLVGKLPDTLIRTLSVQHSIPTIVMDAPSRLVLPKTAPIVPNQFRYKLQVFVILAHPQQEISTLIQVIIKTSIWWNHMASFIIIDSSPKCRFAKKYLFETWGLGLLNTKAICSFVNGHKSSVILINFNPFTSEAPRTWTPAKVHTGLNDHPFSFFAREYQENNRICMDLDFVKTSNLGGYEIMIKGKNSTLEFKDKRYSKISQVWAGRKMVLEGMFRVLNVNPKFNDQSGIANSSTMDIDMRLGKPKGRDTYSYPCHHLGVVIISNFKGHKSQVEKIMSVTDFATRIGMLIVYIITLIFFKYFVHQAFMPAILNLVRMTCNTGFTNLNDNTAPRIYLIGLLFFVITMQGIYQGDLAALLTKKIPHRNINSLNDLLDYDHKIYGTKELKFLLEDSNLMERYTEIENPYKCVMYVRNDLSAVCLEYADGIVIDLAIRYDFHLSNELVAQVATSFPIRQCWYLEEKVNIILGRMVEANILETWERHCRPISLADFQLDKDVLKNTEYKIMELTELLFAFVILGIGLTFATVVFVIEVAIY